MRIAAAAFAALFFAPLAHGQSSAPVVVELFSSQGCYSCPPAEALMREIAERPDVVALEWHVDYWDDLVYGKNGRWKDPFSSAAHTERQRAYNRALRGTTSVYTPQAVVNGRSELVGSREGDLKAAIAEAGADGAVRLQVSAADGDVLVEAEAPSPGARYDVVLVRFEEEAATRVEGGENKGARLVNAHVVTRAESLGRLRGDGGVRAFSARAPEAGAGCAILVHERADAARALGPVVAAAYCPTADNLAS